MSDDEQHAAKKARAASAAEQLAAARAARANRTLGDDASTDVSAAAFVKRQAAMAKRNAERRARQLAEEEAQAEAAYEAADLGGTRVAHALDSFRVEDGRDLADDEATLVDSELAAVEARQRAARKRARKAAGAWADEIDGRGAEASGDESGEHFTLDADGAVDVARRVKAERVARQLDARRQGKVLYDLEQMAGAPRLASDTLPQPSAALAGADGDAGALAAFKKPKKKKRRRKAKPASTAALIAELAGQSAPDDALDTAALDALRARVRERAARRTDAELADDADDARTAERKRREAYEAARANAQRKAAEALADEAQLDEAPGAADDADADDDDDDDADADLYAALDKARSAKASKALSGGVDSVAAQVLARKEARERESEADGGVVYSDTTQFISSVTAANAARMEQREPKAEPKAEPEAEPADAPDMELDASDEAEAAAAAESGVPQAEAARSAAELLAPDADTATLASRDAAAAGSMAATLARIRAQRLAEEDAVYKGRRNDEHVSWAALQADAEAVAAARMAAVSERPNRFAAGAGAPALESERRDYGISLEYRDERGRLMTPKEAYRNQCYKFHGIAPSLNKKEKYEKRFKDEVRARSGAVKDDKQRRKLEKTQAKSKTAGVAMPHLSK